MHVVMDGFRGNDGSLQRERTQRPSNRILECGQGNLGSCSGRSLSHLLRLLRFGLTLLRGIVVGGVHRDLDRDGSATDLLAIESSDSLLLLFLVTDVDEAVALALARLAPAASDDAGRVHGDISIRKELGEAGIVNVEPEVRYEEDALGRLSGGILTSRALGARCTGLASLLLGGGISTFSRSFFLE